MVSLTVSFSEGRYQVYAIVSPAYGQTGTCHLCDVGSQMAQEAMEAYAPGAYPSFRRKAERLQKVLDANQDFLTFVEPTNVKEVIR